MKPPEGAPRVLIVDDEQDIREVLSLLLEDAGYPTVTAASGEEAMDLFRSEQPGIVLSDIKMPGMDGIELLHAVKRESPDTEVIMITGHGDMDLAIRSLKFDATDFITKPINEDILDIALKRARDNIRVRLQLREYTENLERLVAEKTRQLVEAERMAAVGQTVAGLSHAIKNLASGLKGGIFVLGKGIELDHKIYLMQGWEMVRGNVEKLKNLSLDLINFGKSSRIHRVPCDPNQPAQQVAEFMVADAERLEIEFSVELMESPPEVSMDPEEIHKCLMNLVSNAFDALWEARADDREKQVCLTTSLTPGNELEYRVTDTGAGMEKAVLDNLFKSFFSTKGTRGTGIGLMMTRQIVELHGGLISAESEPGKGSTFIIRIPVADENVDSASRPGPEAAPGPPAAH